MCDISVVLPTDSFRTIEPVLASLEKQTIASRIEVLLVSPDALGDPALGRFRGSFFDLRVVPIDTLAPLAKPRGAGVRAARGEWIFIGETHSFLLPDALEILLERGHAGWDVVVPGFLNDNPGSLLSWASFLGSYGRWNQALAAGPIEEAPAYDSLVRRQRMLDLAPGLEAVLLDAELLRQALQEVGSRVFLESRGRIRHANIETLTAFVHEHSLIGRSIGSRRARDFSLGRRLFFLAATPLVPMVLWKRARPGIRSARTRWRLGAHFELAALFMFVCKAFGEALGLLGMPWGPAQVRAMTRYELDRFKFVHGGLSGSAAGMEEHS